MEVSAEAKRIMVVALGKLYSSRTQRGGLRLHRSLLLTLVMKSARDIYHTASEQQHFPPDTSPESPGGREEQHPLGEPRTSSREELSASPAETRIDDAGDTLCPTSPQQPSRKRRGTAAAEPDFLPCKKAKLEQANLAQQLAVNLMDYVNCGELVAPPTPLHLQRAIAVC